MADRVAMFPPAPGEPDQFLDLLANALERGGTQVVPVAGLSPSWAHTANRDVDVVHLHWLEYLAPSDTTPLVGAAKTLRRSLRLVRALRALRRRGVAVVWTIHNIAPHEPRHPRIEQRLACTVLARADRAIVHSEHSKRLVTSRLGPGGKVHVIPLGNYIGVYPPPPQPRDELRRRLGLRPAQFVYLAFGQVRRYKRLPDLLTAFRAIADDDVALIVAGEPRDDAEAARLRELAAQDGRVHLDLRRIPLSDVTAVHEIADAAVFPYRDMFSSASTLLALSCGLPVVVPANSTGTEIVSAPALEPIGPAGLTAALQAVRVGDQRHRREAALATASRYDWARVAQMTERVYELARADRAVGPSG